MSTTRKKEVTRQLSKGERVTPATVTTTSIRATIAQLRELPAEVFWSWPDPNISQRVVDALMPFAVSEQSTTDSTPKPLPEIPKSA